MGAILKVIFLSMISLAVAADPAPVSPKAEDAPASNTSTQVASPPKSAPPAEAPAPAPPGPAVQGNPNETPQILPSPSPSSAPKSEAALMFGDDLIKLRDPFRRPEIQMGQVEAKSDLEQYPVDSYKLVGITTGPSRIRALLLAPNGKTYLASEKVKIGTRGGVVNKITPDQILVREKVVNIIGQEENVDMEITLPAESRESRTSPSSVPQGPSNVINVQPQVQSQAQPYPAQQSVPQHGSSYPTGK